MKELSLEQLQILERNEIHTFNTERLLPFLYRVDRKTAQKIANFRGLNKRGRCGVVWRKAYSAYQMENPNEYNGHYERLIEINRAIQQKLTEEMSF